MTHKPKPVVGGEPPETPDAASSPKGNLVQKIRTESGPQELHFRAQHNQPQETVVGGTRGEVTNVMAATPEKQWKDFDAQRALAIEQFPLILRDIKNLPVRPQGRSINRFLEVRNRALIVFKERMAKENNPHPMKKKLQNLIDEAEKISSLDRKGPLPKRLPEVTQELKNARKILEMVVNEQSAPDKFFHGLKSPFDEPAAADIGLGKVLDQQMTSLERYSNNVEDFPEMPELIPGEDTDRFTAKYYTFPIVIANGAFGAVYQSTNKITGETVAIKSCMNPDQHADFEAEFERCKKLQDNDHLLVSTKLLKADKPFNSFGFPSGTLFFEMLFFNGQDPLKILPAVPEKLKYKIRHESLTDEEKTNLEKRQKLAVKVTQQAADGLEQAHRENIIHGDVKPGNMLTTLDEGDVKTKLCDFGSAVEIGTSTKQLSPTYNAPEALPEIAKIKVEDEKYIYRIKSLGVPASVAQDIYSLGVSLYVLATGIKDPFGINPLEKSGIGTEEILYNAKEEMKKKEWVNPFSELNLKRVGIEGPLAFVINKATSINPNDRFRSMQAMREILDNIGKRGVSERYQAVKEEKAILNTEKGTAGLEKGQRHVVNAEPGSPEERAQRWKLLNG